MPTIAVVGAGPSMGLAIARTQEKLQALADRLGAEGVTAEGVTAKAFTADVTDRPSLTAALDAAKERFGGMARRDFLRGVELPGTRVLPRIRAERGTP
ncbi:hypothetical protein Q8791_10435 [Nocardiopsis sp. CT-R113]|uniref:Uncharacterized protein n=1 Tax=Nocardiopsis codii TaxID=3065942 RepID=A0ABU7K5V9_9ACTN|nr:hypothetical protein [Nocardiopsis sp. CT-R113]MEE2037635.1 hypothetical protein [Nocardiopsis sp. CT-R113]